MARLQLKERQFEPTGNNLGTFLSSDLESFDLQYTDSDEQEDGQEGGAESKQPQSHVPDPFDENPLKDQSDNKQKNSDGNGGQSGEGGSSSGDSGDNNGTNDNPDDDVETADDLNVPDSWDPYGDNPDDEDPDLPDSSNSGDAGYGSSDDSEEDSNDEIMPSSGNESDDADTSDPSQGSNSGEEGNDSDGNGSDDSQSDNSGNNQSGNGSSGDSGEGSDDSNGSNGEPGEGSGDSESTSGQGSPNSGNSSDGGSEDGDSSNSSGGSSGGQGQGSSSSQAGSSYSNSSDKSEGNKSQQAPPTEEELEAEDEDFNPSDGEDDLSDLEKALDTIDNSSTESQKTRNKSQSQEGDPSEDNRSRREIEDEAAAAKDMVGKAVQDVQAENKDNDGNEDDEDDYHRSRDFSEDEEDILKDLGAGNLTSLFNPGNLKDWRSRLDKLFDKATGFDIITNPNLINKKIEDAPPGREDEDPQLKNIVVLIDLSGSMGADKFKQVISHVDTMIRARKLTSVWFHIIGFGDDNIRELERWYTKVKGSKFKQMMMTKYKNDAGWGTRITPGFELAAIKVHKPDAIIVMTDAEIFDGASTLEKNSKAKTFVKKYKNKIIWALTQGASLNKILEIDPTLKAKKRYIKFKKDGKKY